MDSASTSAVIKQRLRSGHDTSFNSGEAWIRPTLIGLPADNSSMAPQALSQLTRSTQVASASPSGPRFHQPLEARPLFIPRLYKDNDD